MQVGGSNQLNNVARSKNQFKYNGQEFQDELELNMTAMDFRQYDNGLGRFHGVDLLAEVDYSGSPYSFSFNNPVYFSDPSGLTPQGGDQEPQSGCPCDGTCVCLSTVDIQGWVRPTSYTIFQSADNRSVAVNIQPSYGPPQRGGGGGVSSLTPAGLIALNAGVIEGARMKNVVGVAGNSASSQTTSTNNSYDSWFFTNQYFAGEASSRVGYFGDFGIKKLAQITFGEYTEEGYITEYFNNRGSVRKFKNHYFEASIAYLYGISVKYDLNKGRFDSFSLSEYGFGIEFSRTSNYNWQLFIGYETGISAGFVLGRSASGKAGWLFK